MSQQYDLPIMICGELKHISDENEIETISYDTGITIRLPKVSDDDLEKIRNSNNKELRDITLDEITVFLRRVGELWADPDYEYRKKVIELSSKTTGFDTCFLAKDMDIIAGYIMTRTELFDQVDSELGNYHYLDEWVSRYDCYVHAEPRGKIVHIMVGNIPLAALITIIRGILTKNINIAKLPSRDITTCLFFAMSFLDVDPDHPITKATNILFWGRGKNNIEDEVLKMADVVCVWGGEEAVKGIKPKVLPGVEFIEFGPKQSMSIINLDLSEESIDKTACRLASDVSLYNQEACLSSQIAFILGKNSDEFIERLAYWMEVNSKRWPKGHIPFDNNAHISITKLSETFYGNKVIASDTNDWAIVICNSLTGRAVHPLGRTIYIHCIDNVNQVASFISRNTQTVGVYPWSFGFSIKDMIIENGADRICELGSHTVPRIGFTHDSIYPLARMIRWVSMERSLHSKGKFLYEDFETDYLFFGYYESEEKLDKYLENKQLPESTYRNRIPKDSM